VSEFRWASDATNARITKIVERLSDDDVVMLANATYFKGRWRSQFDPRDTRTLPFFVTSSVTALVPAMSNDAGLLRLRTLTDGTELGELPYGGDAFVMDIIMPPRGKLEAVIDSLTPARWRAMLAQQPDSSRKLRLQLPKFRLEVSRQLNDDLARLGMPRPFLPGGAQLAPMFSAPARPLMINSVLQKICVDVNEEGTEAAAVTSVLVTITSLPPSFIVNRPFVFISRDRLTGTLLLMGKVVRPATAEAIRSKPARWARYGSIHRLLTRRSAPGQSAEHPEHLRKDHAVSRESGAKASKDSDPMNQPSKDSDPMNRPPSRPHERARRWRAPCGAPRFCLTATTVTK
jgi:serine protease inhibitor